MENIYMNRIGLKLRFAQAICLVFAMVVHFALSENAHATTITWRFDNTPQTVTPTDTVEMVISINVTDNLNPAGYITGFEITLIDPGTLIGQVLGISIDSSTNPYNLLSGFLPGANNANGAANTVGFVGTTIVTLGSLLPIDGFAPFGSFTSGPGTELTFFNFDMSYQTVVTGLNTFTVNVVPEPSTMLLLGSGLAGLGFFRWRRKDRKNPSNA